MITTSLKRSRSLLNKVLPIDIEGDKHSSPSVVTRSSPILNHDSESLHLNKSPVSKNSNKKHLNHQVGKDLIIKILRKLTGIKASQFQSSERKNRKIGAFTIKKRIRYTRSKK